MKTQDPMIRINEPADRMLAQLKHDAFMKEGVKIYKSGIANWLITTCPRMKIVEEKFWEWIKKSKEEVGE